MFAHKWQTASPCLSRCDEPLIINRRSHDALHEAGMKFEAWMFLEYCRFWPSRIVEPDAMNGSACFCFPRDGELTDSLFKSLYYVEKTNHGPPHRLSRHPTR